jgi:hypothetical protein
MRGNLKKIQVEILRQCTWSFYQEVASASNLHADIYEIYMS